MTRFSSIFSQLLQLFPRTEFEQAVKRHNAARPGLRVSFSASCHPKMI